MWPHILKPAYLAQTCEKYEIIKMSLELELEVEQAVSRILLSI